MSGTCTSVIDLHPIQMDFLIYLSPGLFKETGGGRAGASILGNAISGPSDSLRTYKGGSVHMRTCVVE